MKRSTLLLAAIVAAMTVMVGAVGAAFAQTADDRPLPRVVGGSATTIENWPWQVALVVPQEAQPGDQNAFERLFCGGSLVAPTLVITAAHCMYDTGLLDSCDPLTSGFVFGPEDQNVVVNRTTLSSAAGSEVEIEQVYYFVPGPGGTPTTSSEIPSDGDELFDCQTFEWDVFILELAAPVTTPGIQLAGPDEAPVWAPGSRAFVTGWGATSESGPTSDTLQVAEIAIIDDATCAQPAVYDGQFFAETMLCAGVVSGGRDTCQGDSGGPLVVPAEVGTAVGFRLVGDTSFGEGCARPNKPGVYGRIADDPMRSALAKAAQEIGGANIVGSGARAIAPPETTIGKHPKKLVKTRKKRIRAKFTFSANEPASFRCKLDARPFEQCTSPFRKKVKAGRDGGRPRKHRFKVQAIDSLGQPDATVAKFKWRVKRRS